MHDWANWWMIFLLFLLLPFFSLNLKKRIALTSLFAFSWEKDGWSFFPLLFLFLAVLNCRAQQCRFWLNAAKLGADSSETRRWIREKSHWSPQPPSSEPWPPHSRFASSSPTPKTTSLESTLLKMVKTASFPRPLLLRALSTPQNEEGQIAQFDIWF